MKASKWPTTWKRIVARARPRRPTCGSTASTRCASPVAKTGEALRSLRKQPRRQVDGEGDDDGVEGERHQAVERAQLAQAFGREVHVGGGAGDADDDREMQEVPVVGL